MAVTSRVPVSRPRGRNARSRAAAIAARGLNTTASAAAQSNRQQGERGKQRANVDEIAREDRAGDGDDQNRDDAEQAIHQDRRHRVDASDAFFRQARTRAPRRRRRSPAETCPRTC